MTESKSHSKLQPAWTKLYDTVVGTTAYQNGWAHPDNVRFVQMYDDIKELEEQYQALRRVAEDVRDGWLIEHADDALLDKALHDLDAFLQASNPATNPKEEA